MTNSFRGGCVRPGQVRIPNRPRIKIKYGLDSLALQLVHGNNRDIIKYGFGIIYTF
jgi:hypothetical protein